MPDERSHSWDLTQWPGLILSLPPPISIHSRIEAILVMYVPLQDYCQFQVPAMQILWL